MLPLKLISVVVFMVVVVSSGYAQTILNPDQFCGQHSNGTCEPCINARQVNGSTSTICFYCAADKQCKHFTETTVFPFDGLPCPNLEYNVGTCAITALVIAILIALALVLVIVMTCCVCCCCCVWCAQRRKRVRMVEENRYLEEKDNIRQRSTDRRAERKAKHDEIRRKYGLYNEEEQAGNYKRLES